jgi:catechol 2,3-dioxygenase-like lactoylglutathione lyase family enzyme
MSIKATLGLLVCFLLATPCAASAEEKLRGSLSQEPLQGKNMRIKRSTLLVHDLFRSIAFYRDIIGLELYDLEEEYNTDPDSYGYPLFNIPMGARKRMALFNTSDEVRGFAIEEVLDFDWEVQQVPRVSTVLFETDDIAGLEQRLRDGGFKVFEPAKGSAYDKHFVELGFLDPDGHLLSAYQYFPEGK